MLNEKTIKSHYISVSDLKRWVNNGDFKIILRNNPNRFLQYDKKTNFKAIACEKNIYKSELSNKQFESFYTETFDNPNNETITILLSEINNADNKNLLIDKNLLSKLNFYLVSNKLRSPMWKKHLSTDDLLLKNNNKIINKKLSVADMLILLSSNKARNSETGEIVDFKKIMLQYTNLETSDFVVHKFRNYKDLIFCNVPILMVKFKRNEHWYVRLDYETILEFFINKPQKILGNKIKSKFVFHNQLDTFIKEYNKFNIFIPIHKEFLMFFKDHTFDANKIVWNEN